MQVSASGLFALVQHELLLFAAFFFILGALDEFAVDFAYLWLRLSGRAKTLRIDEGEFAGLPLSGRAAVFVPAWKEAKVIGTMLRHATSAWPQADLRFFVGCYRNDAETLAVVTASAKRDPRIILVTHQADGPTCKADCLNALYRAMLSEELRSELQFRMIVLQDAEDMVDPMVLSLLDRAIEDAEFVQLPVLALPQKGSPLVAGHYSDEFAESHGKAMVVRDALGGGIPGAGVGCAITRQALGQFDKLSDGAGPFAVHSLTEDYELGLAVHANGGRTRFLRARTKSGRLIATRSYFPSEIVAAVRQKARWVHGVALQGWDRTGWARGVAANWMRMRDRRSPFAAVVLLIAYVVVAVTALGFVASKTGLMAPAQLDPTVKIFLLITTIAFFWRATARAAFTTREHGWRQGLLAMPRILVSNYVAILAARRAIFAYVTTLRGAPTIWEKTDHATHPASASNASKVG